MVVVVLAGDFMFVYGSDNGGQDKPITLDAIPHQQADELTPITFTASAFGNGTLAFSLSGSPPDGASINATTGVFSWTPSEDQDGSHVVTVVASGGNGGTDSRTSG